MNGRPTERLAGTGAVRPTVVSLTPVPAGRDSRALKIAGTFARMGLHSLLVEQHAGRLRSVELDGGPPGVPDDRAVPEHGARVAGLRGRLFGGRGAGWRASAAEALYRGAFYWKYAFREIHRIPRADLYYLHDFRHSALIRFAAWRCGVPYVYDAHDYYSGLRRDAGGPEFYRTRVHRFLEREEARCASAAAAVVTVSDGLAGLLRERFGCAIHVARNVHDGRLDRDGPSLRESLGIGAHELLVVVVGNAKPGQALESTCDALAAMRDDVHVAFVGHGYERLAGTIRRLGLERRAHLPGRLDAACIVPALRGADAALVAYFALSDNYRMALPNGLFQSIAAGLPVVHSTELDEVLALSERFPFAVATDVRDPIALRGALEAVLFDRPRKNALARAARTASAELTWEREEAVLIELASDLLAGVSVCEAP